MGFFSKNDIRMEEDAFIFKSKYFSYEIPYTDIKDVKLRDDIDLGRMITGTSGALSHYGNFKNDDYGSYDVIFHVTAKLLIVLEFGEGKHVVFNMGNVESTKDFYKKLKGKARLL
ncbi:PH domain-containing protein [Methanomethylophilus alvi]|uniref:PH domain-containing protein n=2 Tax=Methanomethylophilus alvi TaxID=1291540 RepID=UPI0037DD5F95